MMFKALLYRHHTALNNTNYTVLIRYCVNSCNVPGYCTPQALRYYTVTLPLGVPAGQDLLRLIPYYPPYLLSRSVSCEFKYIFNDNSSPFGVRKLGNQAIVFANHPLVKPGMHQLDVKADIKYADGSSTCKTEFKIYIDVARYLF